MTERTNSQNNGIKTSHEGWKIVGIKWDNQSIKPAWIENILDNLYEDYDAIYEDTNLIAKWYNKPLSHFKIDYVTIIVTRDDFNNIINKETK